MSADDWVVTSTESVNVPSDHYSLIISRFKAIESYSLTLPSKGVILLDGKTGSGKTSILEAISFVLYDESGNSCYPRQDRNKKKHEPTSVQLIFPNGLTLYRQRRPPAFKVVGPGVSLEQEDVAQGYINRTLGPSSSWFAGCYLRQGENCAFFSMSPSDKLSFLEELSVVFRTQQEEFEVHLNKCNTKIEEVTPKVKQAEDEVKLYEDRYMQIWNRLSENTKKEVPWSEDIIRTHLKTYGCTTTDLQELKIRHKQWIYEETQRMNREINHQHVLLTQMQENIRQRKILEASCTKLQQELATVPDRTNEIHKLELQISELTQQIALAQKFERRSHLLMMKSDVERQLAAIPDEKTTYQWGELDNLERLFSGPTLDQIQSQLEGIAKTKQYNDNMLKYRERTRLESEVERLSRELERIPTESMADAIEDLGKKIWALSLQEKRLVCPSCNTSLYLNGNNLTPLQPCEVPPETNTFQLQQERNRLQQQQNQYLQRPQLERSLENTKVSLSKLHSSRDFDPKVVPPYVNVAPAQLEQRTIDLERTKKQLTDAPRIDPKEEKKKWQYQQERSRLLREADRLSSELDQYQISASSSAEVSALMLKEKETRTLLQEYRAIQTRRLSLEAALEQLLKQIGSESSGQSSPDGPFPIIDDSELKRLQAQLQETVKTGEEFQQTIGSQIELHHLLHLHEQHQIKQREHIGLHARMTTLNKIKANLITAEYIRLDNFLSKINSVIASILEMLFQEPITVALRSFKQMKSTDRVKPQINCEIYYKGAVCNSVTELSGGERSRVSLAMSIAFSTFTSAPFFLIDESVSTLDVTTKELTMKVIRHYLRDKLVIAVNHDTTNGVYDSVIRL